MMNEFTQNSAMEWIPLPSSAGNFDSYYLAQTKTGAFAFRATRLAFLFSWGFIVVGFILCFMMQWDMSREAAFLSMEKAILLIPLAFILAGCVMLYFS